MKSRMKSCVTIAAVLMASLSVGGSTPVQGIDYISGHKLSGKVTVDGKYPNTTVMVFAMSEAQHEADLDCAKKAENTRNPTWGALKGCALRLGGSILSADAMPDQYNTVQRFTLEHLATGDYIFVAISGFLGGERGLAHRTHIEADRPNYDFDIHGDTILRLN